jgi:Tol biopolymer transport system component
MTIWLLSVVALTVSAAGVNSTNTTGITITPRLEGAYFGQSFPGETPVLFAPAILTALSAFAGAPTFSPDGSQCFVSVGAADYATPATLYYSEYSNGAWKPFAKAPFLADFASSCESVFSADGHTLTFTGKKSVSDSTDFWTVDCSAHVWGTPVWLPAPINSGANEWRGSIMADGTRYFGSERDKPGIYQIFKACLDANRKPVVEKLGLPINMNSYEGDPCIAPDGHFLIFCSGRNGGSTDLFVSFSDGKGGWGTPIDLGAAFNTRNDEYGAYLSHDGKYLFFTRHTSQGDGIYWVATSAIEKLKY